jgi:catechol 2,3-dioxygenase-like lactoylglutathione lyase family enzyme
MDMKLEVVTIPVSDVDRAKKFYESLGWRLDETPPGVVQLTPPGSGCSVQFGPHRTSAPPGSAENLFLVVPDIEKARDELVAAGVEASDVFHRVVQVDADGQILGAEPDLASGPDPEHRSYQSYASFRDPDGNGWLLQEITTRLPGRIDSAATTFASASDLAAALRRAESAHGEHEKRMGGERDANWPAWYASYMIAEQAGTELPQ